jgi:hypothetical protein
MPHSLPQDFPAMKRILPLSLVFVVAHVLLIGATLALATLN